MIMFIKFYLIFIGFTLFFWLTGWGIKKLLKISEVVSYASVLFNVLIGLITFSTVVAVFYTKGKTVMMLSILLTIILYFLYKKNQTVYNLTFSAKKDVKLTLFNLFIGCSMVYTISFFLYTKNSLIITSDNDYSFYANLSYAVAKTGVEHYYANYVMPPNGVQTYHYLEIWLNSGIAIITGQNNLAVLLLVTYPVFIFLFYTGVCALLSYVSFSVKYAFFIAFPATFITGFSLPETLLYEYLYKKFYIDLYSRTLWDYHKISVIYVFLVSIALLFLQKKQREAYLMLLSVPVFYSTTIPSVYGGVGLLTVYLVLYKKNNGKWLFANFLALFGGLLVFYGIFQDKNIGAPDIDLGNVRTKINIIGNTLLGIFFAYWYIPLLGYFFLREYIIRLFKSEPYAWLIVLIPAFALSGWVIFSKNLDSVQIFSNITTPILNLSAISILILLFKYQSKKIFWLCFIIVSGSSIYEVSANYLCKVYISTHNEKHIGKLKTMKNALQNKTSRLGVFFRDSSDFGKSLFYTNGYSSSIVFDLSSVFSDAYAVLLNVHEINPEVFSEPHKKEIAKKLIRISIFNRYIEKQKQQGKFVSIAQSQVDFIKEYKATYIATRSGYKLPDHLNALVKQKIHLGEQVLYLLE